MSRIILSPPTFLVHIKISVQKEECIALQVIASRKPLLRFNLSGELLSPSSFSNEKQQHRDVHLHQSRPEEDMYHHFVIGRRLRSVNTTMINSVGKETETRRSTKSSQMRLGLPSTVVVVDLFGVSDQAVAAIASSVLHDVGLITSINSDLVVDENKLRREKAKVKKDLNSKL
ncbi:hypothetical protein AVEN_88887-1 [Araneus ventricosus]|uniref:Uncharacterized protein n=1 Tax=Araneus ventricosus TaxID=182803 RepID=A0A4Y2MGA5_ARAVE|nr:hypothetical protein AVEN_88887-1 [Araneus ventricosus]